MARHATESSGGEGEGARERSVLITGATGMVGGLALGMALDHPEVASVTTLGRRSPGVRHPKLRDVVHTDFADLEAVGDALGGQDVVLYCLGVYTGSVPDDELRRVTLDLTVAFARALHARSPDAAFCFLSGQGADPTGRSRMAFARYKGAAERELLEMGFGRVHVFRPGYIYPVEPREEPTFAYRVMRRLYPVVRRLYPNVGLASDDLARAMLQAGLHGTPGHDSPVLENRDIREMAARLA